MELKTKHYYDDETLEFVASKFFIDNEQVDIDVYMDYCNELQKINGDCECNCDSCERDDCCEECTEKDCCNECDDCNEYIDDDMDCGNCIYNKEEISDELLETVNLIEDYAQKIENAECDCGACLRNILYELFCVGKGIGFDDAKDAMSEFLGV